MTSFTTLKRQLEHVTKEKDRYKSFCDTKHLEVKKLMVENGNLHGLYEQNQNVIEQYKTAVHKVHQKHQEEIAYYVNLLEKLKLQSPMAYNGLIKE